MARTKTTDGDLVPVTKALLEAVSRGEVFGHNDVEKFGAAESVGTSWTVITSSATYQMPTTAASLEVVSTDNTNDIAAGTGARSVTIEGLDASWAFQTATTTLTGTTAAAVSGTWTRVFRMYLGGSGTYANVSTPSHNSTITVRGASGGVTWGVINTDAGYGFGQSLIGCYTVPAGDTAYIRNIRLVVESNKPVTVIMLKRGASDTVSAPYGAMRLQQIWRGVDKVLEQDHNLMLGPYEGPCDIVFMGRAATGTADISVIFDLMRVAD